MYLSLQLYTEIMIKEIVFIVLLFPVTQQYPLEKKESVLSESRLQNESPIRLNLILSTTPYHLTKAHPLRRKSRNVFKLPDDVLDGRGGNIHKSEHSAKSKLHEQFSSNGISKSRNEFKLPNNDRKTKGSNLWTTKGPNVLKTRGPNVWKTRGPNVWKTRGPNVWKTRGPNVLTTKGPNVWKTRGPNVLTTKGPNVLTTKQPSVQPTETFTNNNIKTTFSTSPNVLKTKVPNVQPYDKNRYNESALNLSETIEYEKHNIAMVAGSIVIIVTLGIAAIVLYNVKCLRQRIQVFSICTSSNEQSRTMNGETTNQHGIERKLINGHKEPIAIGIDNGSD